MPHSRRRAKCSRISEEGERVQPEESGNDSCPLLEDDELSSDVRPQRMCDVRRIDNGVLGFKRSLGERIRGRKNRVVQRVLVACRLAEPSRNLTFKQVETNNRSAIEQLATLRSGLFAHSQGVVNLAMAICCFTGNSARLQEDPQDALASISVEGHKIQESAFVFVDQVEKSVLAKIDRRITELERIHSLIEDRAKLVLEVEYAKRTLMVEQQKGNTNRIAERKHALETSQLECERATRYVTEQLNFVRSNQDVSMIELVQEYAQIAAQFFKRGAELVAAE